MKVNLDKLIETVSVNDLLKILELDLYEESRHSCLGDDHMFAYCEWFEAVERVYWPIWAYQLDLTDLYALRWTRTEEAGIDDVEVVERIDGTRNEEALRLRDWLVDIAASLGTKVRNQEAYYSEPQQTEKKE